MYRVFFSSQSLKDLQKLKSLNLSKKAKELVEIIKQNPYQTPPPFEKLRGNLKGFFSRRINIQHRLIYQVLDDEKIVKVLRLLSHYK